MRLSFRRFSLLVCFFAVALGGAVGSVPANATVLQEDEKQEEAQEQESESEAEQEEDQENGEADLDEALTLNITAKSTRDLDRVAELCESAIDKGLDAEGEEQAKQIWVAVLMEYSNQLSARIFDSGGQDRRWRVYRRDSLIRLRQAVELNPELGDAYLLIARLNGLPGGDPDEGTEAIERAVELAGDDQEKLSNALFVRATLSQGDEKVLGDLEQAIKINPNNTDAIRFRGAYYLRTNQPEKAIEDFKRYLESDQDNLTAYYLVVETLRGIDRYDEAMEILDKAIEIDPNNSSTFVVRAQVRLDQEEYDQVIEEASKAIELDESNFTARLLRAQAAMAVEKYDQAMEDVEQSLAVEPRSVGALHLRAMINASEENYAKAIEDLEVLVQGVPGDLGYQIQLASLYSANLEPKRAVRIFNRLLRQLPEESPARLNVYRGRGDAYLSLGEHQKAVEDYNLALEFNADDDHTLNNLAWVLATSPEDDVRDGKRSIELATRACEVTEWKEAHILSTLASRYAEAGDFENAKKYINQGLEIAGSDEQRESMTNELNHYLENKPFRELQDIEQERAERDKKKEAESDAGDEGSEDESGDGGEESESEEEKGGDGGF